LFVFLGKAAIYPDFTSALSYCGALAVEKERNFDIQAAIIFRCTVQGSDDAHRASGTNVSVGAVLID
jgi:hypothetical protein